MTISRYCFRTIALIICCLIWPLIQGCNRDVSSLPTARHGVININSSDLERQKVIRLDGEWEFYWEKLLTPSDFKGGKQPEKTGYINFSSTWNGYDAAGIKLGGQGYATYRLLINSDMDYYNLVLRLFEITSAYKLWINGELKAESGVVGRSIAGEIAGPSLQMPSFNGTVHPVELILQVSNHHFRDGGGTSPILFGYEKDMESWQISQWGLSLFCIGSLLIMGIYHLVLFVFRRSNLAPLYFGLYCLLWGGNILVSSSSGWVVSLFLSLPQMVLFRLELFFFFLSLPVGFAFFNSLYRQEFSRQILKLMWMITFCFLCFAIFAPIVLLASFLAPYYSVSILLIIYCLVMLYRAVRRGREGARFILAGFLVLGCIAINDMLYQLQVIHSIYLIHVGMFFFVLFQAFALSLRFSNTFSAVEHLTGELVGKNQALEEEMFERNKLEHKIVNISEDERRHISHALHDGLCQQLTAARLRFSVLRRKLSAMDVEQVELTKLSNLLDESVNHAYDLSRGLWPVECDPVGMIPSLEELAGRLSESSGIDIEFRQALRCEKCSNMHIIQFYRIAQEAITNSVKHSKADRVKVEFDCLGTDIKLSVCDNGIGRKAAAKSSGGLGTGIMHHRARIIGGSLRIDDAKDGGTCVVCNAACVLIAETGATEC